MRSLRILMFLGMAMGIMDVCLYAGHLVWFFKAHAEELLLYDVRREFVHCKVVELLQVMARYQFRTPGEGCLVDEGVAGEVQQIYKDEDRG